MDRHILPFLTGLCLLLSPHLAWAACEDADRRLLSQNEQIAIYFRRDAPSLGSQSIHWGIQNKTAHELEVRFVKEYAAGGRPLPGDSTGGVRVGANALVYGGNFQGDLSLWNSFSVQKDIAPAACVDWVGVRDVVVRDLTEEHNRQEASANKSEAEAAQREEEQRRLAAAAAARAESAQKAKEEAAAARADRERKAAAARARQQEAFAAQQRAAAQRQDSQAAELKKKEAAIQAQYEANMAAAQSIGALGEQVANAVGQLLAQRQAEERARAERAEQQEELAELREERREEQRRAKEEEQFWAKPADIPSIEGRIVSSGLVGSSGSESPLLRKGELGPGLKQVSFSVKLRHPPFDTEIAVPIGCTLGPSGGQPARTWETMLRLRAGTETSELGTSQGWTGGAPFPPGDHSLQCSADGTTFKTVTFRVVAPSELEERRVAERVAAEVEAQRKAAEARAKRDREVAAREKREERAMKPAFFDYRNSGTVAVGLWTGTAAGDRAGNTRSLRYQWDVGRAEVGLGLAQVRIAQDDPLLRVQEDGPGVWLAEGSTGLALLRWPADQGVVPWQVMGLSAGLGLGAGLEPVMGGRVAYAAPYVANTLTWRRFALRIGTERSLLGTGLVTDRVGASIGILTNQGNN